MRTDNQQFSNYTADDTQRILLSHTYIDDHGVSLSSNLEVMVKVYDTAGLEVFIP